MARTTLDITIGVIEGIIAKCAKEGVSAMDPIAQRYPDLITFGKLLGCIQDAVLDKFKVRIDLTNRPPAELEKVRAGTYATLALYVLSIMVKGMSADAGATL